MTNGKEYGVALYELALSEDRLESVSQSLRTLYDVFKSEPEYFDCLLSPAVPSGKRIDDIQKDFSGRVDEYVIYTLCLLTEHRHVGYFFDCADTFFSLYDDLKKRSNAVVYSAVELDGDEKSKIKAALEKRSKTNVNIEYKIDESIIGGIVVETAGPRMDGSLKQRLYDIKDGLKL